MECLHLQWFVSFKKDFSSPLERVRWQKDAYFAFLICNFANDICLLILPVSVLDVLLTTDVIISFIVYCEALRGDRCDVGLYISKLID